MRAVTVTGAALAFVGCCLFVMHTENASFQVESAKLWEEASGLPAAMKRAAQKAGDAARGPVVKASPTVADGVHAVVGESKVKSTKWAAPREKWAAAHGHLETNCLALKAFAYVANDEILDSSFKQLGVTYDLLRAVTPSAKPEEDNMSPKDCVKQYKGFVAATKAKYKLDDSLPEMQLKAIEHSMEQDGGILILPKVNDAAKKVITIDGKKIGLGLTAAIKVGVKADQADVFQMLNSMKGSYHAVAMSIKVQENGLDKADSEGLEAWNGKE